MAIPLTINGVTFQYPQQFDRNWGPTLTNWSQAVTNALAPLTGGFLTLPYPTAGIVFRNPTDTADLPLTVNGSNQLTFNGIPIGATTSLLDGHIFVGNPSNNPADVTMSGDITITNAGVTSIGAGKVLNANIGASAAIAFSKLASTSPYFWYAADSGGVLSPLGVTASRAVITDANGLPSASSVTPTELGYVSGVTSAIQTQLNTVNSSFLPLAGGTMSGNINMASNKITSLTNGSAAGDAVAFNQVKVIQAGIQATSTTSTGTSSSTFQVTNLEATITPTSASNRIKITVTGALSVVLASPGSATAFATIKRGLTDLDATGNGFMEYAVASGGVGTHRIITGVTYIDSPATTSPIAYHVYVRNDDNSTSVSWGGNMNQIMILEEIV